MIVQKYLMSENICSRREAEEFLRAGLVYINGEKATGRVMVEPGDVVTLDPLAEERLSAKTTVAVYKPRGIMCSRIEHEGTNVFDVFPQFNELNLVGRLDKDSEGLLLLSNDGLITKAITGDTHHIEKEYEVTVREEIIPEKLQSFTKGITLSDGPTLPAKVQIINNHTFRITLLEGRNRQIRRMCGTIFLTILSLKRIRIGTITLGDMQSGDSKNVTPEELRYLKSI